MKQTLEIHNALKRLMRQEHHTYAAAAEVLKLSEASVKRLFSTGSLSLRRLERLCDWLKIDIADLVAMSEAGKPITTQLSSDQELELLSDQKLLLVTFLVLNHWQEQDICRTFAFNSRELFTYWVRLEEMALIEILPFSRIKVRAARNFSWRKDGPIQQFFVQQVMPEFLNTHFEEPGEKMQFVGGMLSRASVLKLHQRIDDIAKELDQLVEQDLSLPVEERYGVSLFMGLRPWEFSAFTAFRREARSKYF